MPHIIVEHSENLSDPAHEASLLSELQQVVIDSGLFSPEAVKARSISFEHYVLPGDARHFMHVMVSILSGRTLEQRQSLSQLVFDKTKALVGDIDKLSVDIHEMDKETYRK